MKAGTEIDVAGRTLVVSNPEKLYFPAAGLTKIRLVEYYLGIGEALVRQMLDRPVMLQRFPDGVAGTSFYQKRIPDSAPSWLTTTEVRTVAGTRSQALVIADLAHLIWAVNLGCIGFHSWPVRAPRVDVVDELRVDLDPSPGCDLTMLRDAAAAVRSLLTELDITGHLKTSGSRGLHIYIRLVPGYDSLTVRRAAVALARELERRHPEILTAAWWKEERGRRIFVDYNQNAPHRTMFSPWSVRALDHAPVSLPIPWDLLHDVEPSGVTMTIAPEFVARHGDAWSAIDDRAADLDRLLALAERDVERGLPDAPWPPEYPKMSGEAPRVAPSRARRS